ncbi:MAG TPA: hypothetical protein VKR61_04125 [Bryobacteraceae bacterium]|nr:hypothetical protein [Bryobacteraceae bacterium]
MLKTADIVAWIFPFFGAVLVCRGGHVLFIAAGSVAGCTFERIADELRLRTDQDRKIREIDRNLVTRLRELG